MRLSEVLRLHEDDEVCRKRKTIKKKSPIPSPRRIFSTLLPFRSLLRCRSFEEHEAPPRTPAARDEDVISPPAPPSMEEEEEGRNLGQRIHLSIGMGAGLAHLLTRSNSEVRKMVELRKEMESFMEECKAAIQRRDLACRESSSEPKNNPHSWNETEPSTFSVEASSRGAGPERRRMSLEAELESELDLLQVNLAKQQLPVLVQPEGDEEMIEEETSMDYVGGVSPRALAGKLHELRERRQQERIEELECALETALAKIREKEMEISLWRETARGASQGR